MKPIQQVQRSTVVPSLASSTSTLPKGASAALQSVQALDTAQAQEKGGGFKKAIVAALIGITLITSVAPAHADTTAVVAPQTASLVLQQDSTGPPGDALAGQQRFERFLGGAPHLSGTSQIATDVVTRAAFDTFTARLTQILRQDAGSLAWGQQPVLAGQPLSAAQQGQVEDALKDLITQMPVGAFGDHVEHALEGVFAVVGHDADLSQVRLADLGDVGGDAAKAILKQLKAEHRGAYNAMVGVAAAGALAIGYAQGTDALRDLGIRPELSTRVFDGARLRLGLDAGPRFSNPALHVGLSGQTQLDNGTVLRGALQTRLSGSGVGETRLGGSMATTSGFQASGEVRFDGSFQPIDTRLSATQQFDRWNVGAEARYNFQNDTFSSTLSAGRTFDLYQKNDLDLQIRGSFDNQGNHHIGVGATFRF
jgi:hypothetical protein